MSKAVTTIDRTQSLDEAGLLQVLQNSVYPGAKTDSIYMVIQTCRAQGLDPLTKPFHIVPIYIKDEKRYRDVIMPGIDLYRIKAHRTGKFLGQSPVEFGPVVEADLDGVRLKHPEWAKITVRRRIDEDTVAEFTVTEYWLENYATAKRDTTAPNSMWRKRPFAQLAKCVEAQALRRGFPDSVGAQATFEEMAGKSLDEMRDYFDVDQETGEIKNRTEEPADRDEALARKLAPSPVETEQVEGPEAEQPPLTATEQESEQATESGEHESIAEMISTICDAKGANVVLAQIEKTDLSGAQKKTLRQLVTARMKQVTS